MTWSISGNTITLDSGTTENDLSGLSSISGVTTTTDTGAIYYDLGTLQVVIRGTLYHDPDEEVLIMHHEHTTATNNNQNGGGTQRAFIVANTGTYYYGKETTAYGNTRLSSSCGLFITGNGFTFWEPWDNGFVVGGKFVARGGVIHTSRSLTMPGELDIKDLTIMNNDDNFYMEIRDVGTAGNGSTIDNLTLVRIDTLDPWKVDNKQSYTFKEAAVTRKYGSDYREVELLDLDFSQNIRSSDTRHNANQTTQQHMDLHVINSASGSTIRNGWRQGNDSWFGSLFVHKEVSFNLKDASGVDISGCKVYLQDNPSDYKRNAQFKYNTGLASGDSTLSRGVVSDDGTNSFRTYDYTTPIVYDKTTDANGNVAKFKVLTSVHFLDLSVKDSSHTQYYTTFSGGKWKEADGLDPRHTDINTTRFGGFFMPDRRSDSNSTADDFTFKFCSYDHSLSKSTQTLKGIGELEVNWVLFDDQLITDTKVNADGYQEIDTPQKFYNRAKAYLVDNYAGETSTIVSREGNSIDAGSYDVVVDGNVTNAASAFNFTPATFTGNFTTPSGQSQTVTITANGKEADITLNGDGTKTVATLASENGATATGDGASEVLASGSSIALDTASITIKATRFVGNIATTGTTTLSNGAEVIGTFGSTTVLPWEVKNVEGTSRIQLVNVTQSNTEVVNTKLTSTDPFIDASGTYTASQIAVGDVVRLRVTCVVGAEALLPVLQTGVATTTGITFQVDQEADTIYNSNGIDGSTVEKRADNASGTLTADYTNPMGVDVSDADGTASVKEIYAFFTYSTTTADGVENWFGGMRAIDNANYEVVTANADIKIQNIGSNAVVVTDGRMYRDDGNSVLYAETGDKPITMDSGALVTSIQPQVEAGLNANSKISSINNNSKLIPGLL